MNQPQSPRSATFRRPVAERQRLENEMRHTVEFARALYDDLSREHSRCCALGHAALTHDRDLLYDHCNELHDSMQLALDQYRAALHRFNRLVIYRELPE